MSKPRPEQSRRIENVSVDLKANVYFEGKVVSHSVYDAQGNKKTLGLIYPGNYTFNTGAPECMQITSGLCQVKVKGDQEWTNYHQGQEFKVPANSSFEIAVKEGITEYLCVFQ